MPRQNSLRTFVTIVQLAARSTTERLLPLVFSLGCTIVTLFGLFSVYQSSIGTASVRGMNLATVLWSLAMYSVYWGVGTRYIFRDISDDVKDGSIEVRLVKPMHYLLWRVAHRLGKQIPMLGQQLVVNFSFLMVYVGAPEVHATPVWFLTTVGLFVLGIFISVMVFICVGLSAFWIENSMPVMWIVDKLVMIVGGAFVPIVLFPNALRLIAEWSPFGAMMAFSQAFTPDFLHHAPFLFVSQALWMMIMAGVVGLMWHLAMKRVAVNGG
ncbi:MAG: ABC-2 family transporter protein [Patescibacteria group bacterium]